MPRLASLLLLASASAVLAHAECAVHFMVPVNSYERDTVAACLVLEAGDQGEMGMRSVMAVICNRAKARQCSLYHVATAPKQFSCFNRAIGSPEAIMALTDRARRERVWHVAVHLADAAYAGALPDPTGGATYYARSDCWPKWRSAVELSVVIGAHSFFHRGG